MKVLHSAYMLRPEPGIQLQMSWEQQAARACNLDWTSKLFCPAENINSNEEIIVTPLAPGSAHKKIIQKISSWYSFRLEYYKWLHEQTSTYDAILLRNSTSDPLRAKFIKSSNIPVYSVHHSLEIPEILSGKNSTRYLKAAIESIVGPSCLRYVSGVIAVTEEIRDYELSRIPDTKKPCYIYPNGIFIPRTDSADLPDERSNTTPEIIFVASHFVPWHGLDLLLDDIASSNEDFILHLFGNLSNHDKDRARHDKRIIIHGVGSQNDINKLSLRCWVGLSSFALYRKNMQEACTLKVREYLYNGLPVYSGHRDIFPCSSIFYRQGKPSISAIIKYAHEIRQLTKSEIFQLALPYISKEALLLSLYKWLQSRRPDGG